MRTLLIGAGLMALCACGSVADEVDASANNQIDAAPGDCTAPTGAAADPNPVCDGASTTLTVTGGSLGSGGAWEWYADSCGGTAVDTGESISVSPTAATTYYVRAEGSCTPTSCASVSVDVDTASVAPTGATANPNPFCNGGSTTLAVTGGSLGTGATWEWYEGSCGGTAVDSGESITVSPAVTTTYYVRAEGSCNMTTCASVEAAAVDCPLYTFSGHTFNNCTATGPTGPTEAQCETEYGTTWATNDAFYTVSGGIQAWVVPETGTYTISIAGAGYDSGSALQRAAVITGDFTLTKGDVLNILVGQMPTGISSGGGGTFVEHATQGLLIAAGGSGGICNATQTFPNVQATAGGTAQSGNLGAGGSGGNGGASSCAAPASNYGGGGGGGYLTDGDDNTTTYGCPGFSFAAGGGGGTNTCGDSVSSDGGFGGGGAGYATCEPAGGGGYSGGGGGGANNNCGGSPDRVGGGGASYNTGANPSASLNHAGHGYVAITPL